MLLSINIFFIFYFCLQNHYHVFAYLYRYIYLHLNIIHPLDRIVRYCKYLQLIFFFLQILAIITKATTSHIFFKVRNKIEILLLTCSYNCRASLDNKNTHEPALKVIARTMNNVVRESSNCFSTRTFLCKTRYSLAGYRVFLVVLK